METRSKTTVFIHYVESPISGKKDGYTLSLNLFMVPGSHFYGCKKIQDISVFGSGINSKLLYSKQVVTRNEKSLRIVLPCPETHGGNLTSVAQSGIPCLV